MTTPIRDLIPAVRTHVDTASEAVVRLYLQRAAKQFCQDTAIWAYDLGSIPLSPPAEDAETEFTVPTEPTGELGWKGDWAAGVYAVGDIVAWNNAHYTCIAARAATDTDPPGSDSEGWETTPIHFTLPAQSILNRISELRFDTRRVIDGSDYRYDVVTGRLVIGRGVIVQSVTAHVRAILEPVSSATTLPAFLTRLWGEAVADYAIWEMLAMPSRPWTNPQLAMVFKQKYQNRVAEATVSKARRGTANPIRLAPTPFV